MASKRKHQRVIELLERKVAVTRNNTWRGELHEAIAVLLYDREHWLRLARERERQTDDDVTAGGNPIRPGPED